MVNNSLNLQHGGVFFHTTLDDLSPIEPPSVGQSIGNPLGRLLIVHSGLQLAMV